MRGAIAAGHPLTAEAGARILAEGGNAVDACIAAAFVAWVAESPLTGPGAGGFMLVHRARDGKDFLLDFFVGVPGAGSPAQQPAEMELVDIPFGSGGTTQPFLIGPASCAVPGAVAGLAEAHRLYGTVPWPELLRPAIQTARRGVELNSSQATLHVVLDAVLRHDSDGRRVYGRDGPLPAGGCVVMEELAGTLELLAGQGADAFYRDELSRRIAASVHERGGRITEVDLASYRVVRRRPVRAAYRGHELVSNPPPSSGGVLIAFALRLLDRLGAGGKAGSAEALARLAEVARESARARRGDFAAALHRGGLPGRLLADACLDAAVTEILAAEVRVPAGEPAGLPSTTHVSVVDARGNAASLSSSTGCGSGVFVPGTGIQLNNMLGEIDLNPPGAPMRPGRRLTSMMAPSILLRGGRPRLVVGSAGSERLRGAIVQTIVNVVDHRMPVGEAIDRPRVHLDGDELHCEAGIEPVEAERLAARGYRIVRWPGDERNLFFGGVSAVGVREDGSLEAAGDPRRGGHGVIARR
jgi:gamma-glutamyltranspeptidase / glutathione hydrolase